MPMPIRFPAHVPGDLRTMGAEEPLLKYAWQHLQDKAPEAAVLARNLQLSAPDVHELLWSYRTGYSPCDWLWKNRAVWEKWLDACDVWPSDKCVKPHNPDVYPQYCYYDP